MELTSDVAEGLVEQTSDIAEGLGESALNGNSLKENFENRLSV